ncbi:MAG: CDP-alcohol phosphatidyltransferase family protein [Proteobacteria bacterium]|jgi:phosphatidylglycerophosphate synthase|nr:CDP-alcohol phosphatidyltransferase family protein [Pseudomonadota bacterium]MDA1301240.1 CDP-alcohol phosphatidyltransferase family protein [Pseudomonadota bacterium]
MLDAQLRRLIDPPLAVLAGRVAKTAVTANQITIAGFLVGLAVVPLLALKLYPAAMVAIAANRLLDGLDGAVARQRGISDAGAYLDIVLDFIFYSAVIFGFALGHPEDGVWAAFLIFSFVGTGSSFLAFAIFANRHGIHTGVEQARSFYYLGGLAEGFETMLALFALCLLPDWFWLISLTFGIMCWITTTSRILWSFHVLTDSPGRTAPPG